MNKLKKGIALFLCTAMCIPSVPAAAEGRQDSTGNTVKFNTGSYEYCVTEESTIDGLRNEFVEKYGDDYADNPDADAERMELGHYVAWEPDGSYEIAVEQDAFFPYEVQFTYDGKTDREWFMTEDSTVEVAGHTFRLDVPKASGDVVTRMELDIHGDTVIVYPEEKEFTNDENSQEAPMSLLPLEERSLTVNLEKYTPVELTKVAFSTIFQGKDNELPEGRSVAWKPSFGSGYQVSMLGDTIDLSKYTTTRYEMIVGENDQLDNENIRYLISVNRLSSYRWLKPSIYEVKDGTRQAVSINSYSYDGYRHEMSVFFLGSEEKNYLFGISLDKTVVADPQFSKMNIYEGKYTEAELANAKDITAEIWKEDISGAGGYQVTLDWGATRDQWFTFVSYDAGGRITGCLPVQMSFYKNRPGVSISASPYLSAETGTDVTDSYTDGYADQVHEYIVTLKRGYQANGTYVLPKFYYYVNGKVESDLSSVKAYLGKHESVSAAEAAQAQDIKDALFKGEYAADFSSGIVISVFVGADGEEQKKFYYRYQTKEAVIELEPEPGKNDDAYVDFSGVAIPQAGGNGPRVNSYILGRGNHDFDSYGDGKYYTIFVDREVELSDGQKQAVDLNNLALVFSLPKGAKLYAEGKGQQVSGESANDFSKGAVQFSVSSEDEANHRNYFIRVIQVNDPEDPAQAAANPAQLYINSLDDSVSNTVRDAQGVVTSTREVFLDSYHNNVHNILVSNVGCTTMSALKVELTDAQDIQLDEYWTLHGKYGLSGLTTVEKADGAPNGELSNLAVVGLKAKEGELEAREYGKLGTLTFTSDQGVRMVLHLTGIVGDPRIVTKEVKNPTKYVPYGIMIMDNNKYDFNQVTYSCTGKLPDGMTLTPSGELYGVPKEAGDFEITVTMHNSYSKFSDDTKTYKFSVLENTDAFVDGAQDPGYELSERIDDIYDVEADGNYLIISPGVFDEYTDLYIDGEKKQKGTDYEAESGSTRITIMAQSLPKSEGTHTIGVEFRKEKSQGKVRAAAQNYHVQKKNSGSSSGSSGGSSGWSGGWSGGGGSAPVNSNTNNKPDNTPADTSQPGGNTGGGTSQPAVNDPKPADSADVSNGKNTTVSKLMLYARNYTAKDGDTLKSLAKKFYGKSSKWKKIYNANKKKFSSSKQLKKGMKLQIPAISYTVKKGDTIKSIAKKYFGANSKWKLIYQVNQDVVTPSLKIKAGQKLVLPVPVVCRIYTVRKGDSLQKIAKKFYGKSSKWQKIYNANKNKVSKSNKVKAGTNLFIPAMTYKVKKGDDIKSIAKKYYGVRSEWRQIYDANKDIIPSSKKLKAGETLVLPVPVDIG